MDLTIDTLEEIERESATAPVTLLRLRIDQLMSFSWKMLIPLALINIAIVAVEVFIWRYWDVTDWILAAYVVINLALTVVLMGAFFRIITSGLYKMPRRVRLVGDIGVPSLPAPPPWTFRP